MPDATTVPTMSLVGSPGRPSSDPRPGGFRSRPTPRYQPTRTTTSEPVTHHESRSLKPKVGRRPGVFPRRRAGRPSDARGPLWPRPPGRPDRGCPEFNPAGSKTRSWQSVFDPSATQDPITAAVVHLIRPPALGSPTASGQVVFPPPRPHWRRTTRWWLGRRGVQRRGRPRGLQAAHSGNPPDRVSAGSDLRDHCGGPLASPLRRSSCSTPVISVLRTPQRTTRSIAWLRSRHIAASPIRQLVLVGHNDGYSGRLPRRPSVASRSVYLQGKKGTKPCAGLAAG